MKVISLGDESSVEAQSSQLPWKQRWPLQLHDIYIYIYLQKDSILKYTL